MAAVMAAGMVPPLAMALASTVLNKKLFSLAEQENGKAAWLLGASFISEGAIPFAAPTRSVSSPPACRRGHGRTDGSRGGVEGPARRHLRFSHENVLGFIWRFGRMVAH
jgi:hypothetical protein